MKKTLLSALAIVALAGATTAFAQEHVIPSTMYDMGIPRAAQTNPEGGRLTTDPSGRTVIVDNAGREIVPGGVVGGGSVFLGYDSLGRALFGNYGNYNRYGNYAYSGRSWDRDGDGIPNRRDRYPDDPRYH